MASGFSSKKRVDIQRNLFTGGVFNEAKGDTAMKIKKTILGVILGSMLAMSLGTATAQVAVTPRIRHDRWELRRDNREVRRDRRELRQDIRERRQDRRQLRRDLRLCPRAI